jgi:flagellar FliL protein
MAKTTPNPEETADGGVPAPAKKSMRGKLLILLLVIVGLIAGECVLVEVCVAYFCLPTASESTVAAKPGYPSTGPDHRKGEVEPAVENEGDGTVEVDLKEYSVTVYQPASNSTLRIDFHLWGSVAKDKEKDFKSLFEANQARFREQVVFTVRSAEMADLTDPSLGLIKRTILDKAKTILGQPLLKEVIISDYSSLEQ